MKSTSQSSKSKYRTENYKPNSKTYSQTFSNLEDDYLFDKETKTLIKVGQINIQEKIQSNEGCALDKILDKFIDFGVIDSGVLNNGVRKPRLDLAQLGEIYSQADFYKTKYGLDENMSPEDVFKYVIELEKSNKTNIENLVKKDNISKEEVKTDETKKVVEESK